ncbi:MAG: amidohydrolase family protein, partial [Synergistes sp.]|nr:amidohydrolase family protein [Synergistes sp.]
MIIDFHTHIFPDAIADAAMKSLSMHGRLGYDGIPKLAELVESMDGHGIDKSIVLNVATKASQHENILRFSKRISSDRIIPFGSVVPSSPDALSYVQKMAEAGIKGLKFHPPYEQIIADDKGLYPLYDLARSLNLIIVFHAGWDPVFPEYTGAAPEKIADAAKNFPGLRIVAAHMGGLHFAREVYENIAGKSELYFDTSDSDGPWMDKNIFRDIIRRHGAEKILFASDYPWHIQSREINMVMDADLSTEEKELILHGNAERLLGL